MPHIFNFVLNGVFGAGQHVDDPADGSDHADDRKEKDEDEEPSGAFGEMNECMFHAGTA